MRVLPRRLGGWPAGLFGALALVLVMERYVARHDMKFTTIHAAAWRRSGERVTQAARREVLGLGDSLVKHGVVTPVLAASAGRSAYNLAVPKGMFPAHYFLLRRALRAGARPSALLVDGEMLSEDPFDNNRIWPELISFGESVELAYVGKEPAFIARMTLARGLPSYRTRFEVRLSVLSALAGKMPDEPQALPVIMRNWNKNDGAQVLPPVDTSHGDPRVTYLERTNYRPGEWICHPVNHWYVTRFLDLAAQRDVPVFWLLPPYHPEVQTRRERYGWDAQYMAYLRSLLERYSNLTVVDGRHAGYPSEALADMTHLSRTGAVVFSEAVGGLLRDRLAPGANGAGARWIEIPRYDAARAEALASAVEDVSQSGLALERVMTEARRARQERRLGRGERTSENRRRR
ncbi:MAG: hypothetical protein NVSMB9_02430 [Isosphaeraceae bacterium]